MRAPLALVLALTLAPRAAAAQSNSAELLARAVALYEEVQIERALELLRQIISPSSPFEVSRGQRVEAYKYLGASLATIGQRDSALVYFRAAIERDPFLELPEATFTPGEREAFAEARRATFALGVRPVSALRFDPATDGAVFTFVTTQPAEVRALVRLPGGQPERVLSERPLEGTGETRWNGVGSDGRLVPAGRYEFVVTGTSALTGIVDSASVYFDLRHEHPALDDTLPEFRPEALLPERYPRSAAGRLFARGLGVAVAALLLPKVVSHHTLRDGSALPQAVAAAAIASGIAASLERQRQPEIPANIAENQRRRAERARLNAEITRRNAERLALTQLVVVPAAGAAP
ncbi:MAG TPA: hypothetical protein VNA89_02700 [Gemmatimonadaceae bacterium]|nr:hypothetical protein [Gemmatimonadaceae bacterium]